MTLLITDPAMRDRLIAERQASGGDKFDEVWEGVYVMPPLANDEHQELTARFTTMLQNALGWDSPAKVRAGVNVSDRDVDWTSNYRCPDVVVYLPDNPAQNRDTHWVGGPDFLVEIASEYDRSWEKLPFYASVGVREVLIVNRNPWVVEMYQLSGTPPVLQLVGTSTIETGAELRSGVLPMAFRLVAGTERPKIEALMTSGSAGRWLI